MKVLVIDTETGGLDPFEHSILSLGAVVYEDGIKNDSFYALIKEPIINTTEKALKVNGFTLEEIVEKGNDVGTVLFDFKEFLFKNFPPDRITLVGHNVAFDVGFLKRLFRVAGQHDEFDHLFSYRTIDTQSIALVLHLAGRFPSLKSTSLDSVANVFHLKRYSKKHNAEEDAMLTADVLGHMINLMKLRADVI